MRKTLNVAIAFLATVGVVFGAATPAIAVDVPYFEKPHIWIDNVANPSAQFSTNFHGFTSLQGHAVSHGQISRFYPVDPNAQMVVHCNAPRPTGVSSVGCQTASSPTSAVLPGDYSFAVDIREDQNGTAVTVYSGTLPITVCNGPCSSLFDFSFASAPFRVLANTELGSQSRTTVDFNVAWNATTISAGQLVDGNGNPVSGNYVFSADSPRDGSTLGFTGQITQTGKFYLPVTITDEFGVTHSETAEVNVCSDQYCMQGIATLANTGTSAESLGMFSLCAGVFGGLFFLISRRIKLMVTSEA